MRLRSPSRVWGVICGQGCSEHDEDLEVARPLVSLRVGACLLLAGTAACVLWGLALGFQLSGTAEARYKAEIGAHLFQLAPLVVPLAVVALVTRRKWLGFACIACGVLFLGWLSAGALADLRPEPGERRVLADFVPPAGAQPAGPDRFQGFSFPSLTARWMVRSPAETVCRQAMIRMVDWSQTPPQRPIRRCLITGERDGHLGYVDVRSVYDDPTMTEIIFTLTREI